MKHYRIQFEPDRVTAVIHGGATLLEAAGQAGIILANPCGGTGRCGKCKVRLLPSGKEVLACQYTIEHDLTVQIPDVSRFFKQRILEHGIRRPVAAMPTIQKIFIENPPFGIDAFCQRISEKIQSRFIIQDAMNTELEEGLPAFEKTGVTVILTSFEGDNAFPSAPCCKLTGLEAGNPAETLFGLAVDIGTTTIVARLLNLVTGQSAAVVSAGNPQTRYGADVISRIGHSETEDGGRQLHEAVIDCLNNLIRQAAKQGGIEPDAVYEIVAVGNTTMSHLLLKHPVKQLGQAPYRAHSLLAANRNPRDLKIQINPSGNVHTIANIAGFVGSDTVAAALACGMDTTRETILLVDIGTNGEIVLGTGDALSAASCAAGPALEGAGIEFGSRAQDGAIERVLFDGRDIDVDIIGSGKPQSICGSGLIDAASVMLNLGIIDATGRFYESDQLDPMMADSIRKRLITYKNEPAFVLTENSCSPNAVLLTQKDIRQLQLAKAAIRTGIELLLRKAGVSIENIQKLLLAGAFGNYIQKENAVRIGLLPKIPLEKIHFIGNAASSGAEMALLSQEARKCANTLARTINYVEVAGQAEFQMVFSEFLVFPEK